MARRLVLLSAVLAVLLLAMCASFVAAADAVPTEADFKNMKVKQLKAFLSDRGLTCQGCEEKSEFVAMAVANAAKPLLPSKVKSTPKGSFWDAWANVAFEVCESTAGVKGASAEVQGQVCDAMKNAVESLFMQHGKRTATKLRKKPEALLKTSFGEIYQSAGKRMLSKVAGYCFKNQQKCRSSSALEGLLEKDNAIKGVKLITFITNVGIENTNPMYEALKDKSLDKDEL